jgi:hypothetical protein
VHGSLRDAQRVCHMVPHVQYLLLRAVLSLTIRDGTAMSKPKAERAENSPFLLVDHATAHALLRV